MLALTPNRGFVVSVDPGGQELLRAPIETKTPQTLPDGGAAPLVAPPHVGPIVSSDTFYDPDPERHRRWAARGVLAVEMEAAVLFTIAAIRGVEGACLLTVSDIISGEDFTRISDDELAAAVERMTRLALRAAVDER